MLNTKKILLLFTILSLILLMGCGEKDQAGNKSSYEIAMDYFNNNDYEKSLDQFQKTLEQGYNDQDGEVKFLIALLENYCDADDFYKQKEYDKASEKLYLIKDYESYPINNDIKKLRDKIDSQLKPGDKKGKILLLTEVTEKDIPKIKANVKISSEDAKNLLEKKLNDSTLSVEEIGEFDIVVDNTLWYYFHTYIEDEDNEAYYISSKTGEIKEYQELD